MKHMKMAFAVLLCGLLALACGACNKECAHVYGEWETVTQVTCTADGRLERFCTKCGKVEISTVAATGHHFGDWTDGDGVRVRSCAVCGYTETMQQGGGTQGGGTQGGGTQGGTQGGGTVDAVTAVYGSFDLYLADCDGSYYKGSATRFSVNIGEGTRPNNYCFYIPEYVNYVKFKGKLQGNPLYNTTFYVETRTSDLEVEFEDIDIESNVPIFTSETRNINLTLTMSGTKCSFLNTSKAATGADGAKSNGSPFAKIEDGQTGATGSSTFIVNGHCKVLCKAQQLVIKGGEGGDGGQGTWASMPNQYSGNGGNGGRGGLAFQAENAVDVYVKSGSQASISGGAGGNGGSAGGSSASVFPKTGSNGSRGSDGGTGCNSPRELYE